MGTPQHSDVMLLGIEPTVGPVIPFTIIAPTSPYTIPSTSNAHIRLAGSAGKAVQIFWDDGTSTTYTLTPASQYVIHTYSTAGTYDCTIEGDTDFITLLDMYNVPTQISIDDMTSSIVYLSLVSINRVSGTTFSNLSSSMTNLYLSPLTSTYFTGDLIDIPTSLIELSLLSTDGATNLTGTLSNLPSSLISLTLSNLDSIENPLTDDLEDLATSCPNIVTIFIQLCDSLTGSISSLGIIPSLENLTLKQMTAIIGSIEDLPSSLKNLNLTVLNNTSLTGSIFNMSSVNLGANGLETLTLHSLDGITGDLDNTFDCPLTYLEIQGCSGLATFDLRNVLSTYGPLGRINLTSNTNSVTYPATGRSWDGLVNLYISPTSPATGLTAAHLENLAYDILNSAPNWGSGSHTLTVQGTCDAPNAQTLAYFATLEGVPYFWDINHN